MSEYRLEQAKALAAEFPTVVLIDPPARKYYAWLIEEVESLRDEVFELKIYRGFGLDHGHEGCVAEIKRLKKLVQEALNEDHATG